MLEQQIGAAAQQALFIEDLLRQQQSMSDMNTLMAQQVSAAVSTRNNLAADNNSAAPRKSAVDMYPAASNDNWAVEMYPVANNNSAGGKTAFETACEKYTAARQNEGVQRVYRGKHNIISLTSNRERGTSYWTCHTSNSKCNVTRCWRSITNKMSSKNTTNHTG